MARQRFIWPDIWKDPTFGRLTADEQVFFIGCFSIADDEGRLNGDPAFLRGELFTYKDLTLKKVQAIRDSVVAKCSHVHLYRASGNDYLVLLKWAEYQRPKYPKPSKLPAPFLEDSPNLPPSLPESGATGRAGLGRVGLDRAGLGSADPESGEDREERLREVGRMLALVKDADDLSETTLMGYAMQLPIGSVAKVRESGSLKGAGRIGVGYFVNGLKSELEERAA
jgi:hypothetical protein